jgi:hypothetical protein
MRPSGSSILVEHMDYLGLRLTPHEETHLGRWTAVDVLVNGKPLKDLAFEFEREHGYDPAGGYDSISLAGLQPAPDALRGTPNTWPGDGEIVLLVCASCREEGCWPLLARVKVGDATVEWSGFRQPHRTSRDYSDLRFAFDRGQYDEELQDAFG